MEVCLNNGTLLKKRQNNMFYMFGIFLSFWDVLQINDNNIIDLEAFYQTLQCPIIQKQCPLWKPEQYGIRQTWGHG